MFQFSGYSNVRTTWKELQLSTRKMENLTVLSASSLNLTGPIGSFAALPASLQSLDLSHNTLSGALHPDFSTLSGLNKLDLSWNKLRGVCRCNAEQ